MEVLENLDFAKAFKELLPELFGEAIGIVVTVTIVGFLLAIVIGFLLALARVSKNKILNGIVVVFQEIIRGTPLLVQLVYVFYVVPLLIEVLMYFLGKPDFKMTMPAVTAGIIGMSINYGTYISEVIRSAILAIDQGQTEAALALGLSKRQAMFRIVIPQAFKNSIPVFGNYLVMLVKDTSLMAYITIFGVVRIPIIRNDKIDNIKYPISFSSQTKHFTLSPFSYIGIVFPRNFSYFEDATIRFVVSSK